LVNLSDQRRQGDVRDAENGRRAKAVRRVDDNRRKKGLPSGGQTQKKNPVKRKRCVTTSKAR